MNIYIYIYVYIKYIYIFIYFYIYMYIYIYILSVLKIENIIVLRFDWRRCFYCFVCRGAHERYRCFYNFSLCNAPSS